MPKRGIHAAMNTFTAVLRNGATVEFQSIIKAARPMRLQIDPTSHPAWTGEKSTLDQDGRAAQFLRKFGQADDAGADSKSSK